MKRRKTGKRQKTPQKVHWRLSDEDTVLLRNALQKTPALNFESFVAIFELAAICRIPLTFIVGADLEARVLNLSALLRNDSSKIEFLASELVLKIGLAEQSQGHRARKLMALRKPDLPAIKDSWPNLTSSLWEGEVSANHVVAAVLFQTKIKFFGRSDLILQMAYLDELETFSNQLQSEISRLKEAIQDSKRLEIKRKALMNRSEALFEKAWPHWGEKFIANKESNFHEFINGLFASTSEKNRRTLDQLVIYLDKHESRQDLENLVREAFLNNEESKKRAELRKEQLEQALKKKLDKDIREQMKRLEKSKRETELLKQRVETVSLLKEVIEEGRVHDFRHIWPRIMKSFNAETIEDSSKVANLLHFYLAAKTVNSTGLDDTYNFLMKLNSTKPHKSELFHSLILRDIADIKKGRAMLRLHREWADRQPEFQRETLEAMRRLQELGLTLEYQNSDTTFLDKMEHLYTSIYGNHR